VVVVAVAVVVVVVVVVPCRLRSAVPVGTTTATIASHYCNPRCDLLNGCNNIYPVTYIILSRIITARLRCAVCAQ